MWTLELPWWELVLRAAAVYAALLVLVRLSGKRTVGQFTPFDMLVVLLLSESVSNALTGGDDSLVAGLLCAATLIALNAALAWLTSRSPRVERLLQGREVLLARNGRVYDDVLRRERVSEDDFDKALRRADCPRGEIGAAFLEADGHITVTRRNPAR